MRKITIEIPDDCFDYEKNISCTYNYQEGSGTVFSKCEIFTIRKYGKDGQCQIIRTKEGLDKIRPCKKCVQSITGESELEYLRRKQGD